MLLLGAHISARDGLADTPLAAAELGCGTFQLFTSNNLQWKTRLITQEEASLFRKNMKKVKIKKAFSHAKYLVNLASPDGDILNKSIDAMVAEINAANSLGLAFSVMHPGSGKGQSAARAVKIIARSIDEIFGAAEPGSAMLLLETVAGAGNQAGASFEELTAIISASKHPDKLGVCLDTAHVFAAGYDIRNEKNYKATMKAFDKAIGLNKLKAMHLNDSKGPLGSKLDRHAHIGEGEIGKEGFRLIMRDKRLNNILKVIETPKAGGLENDRMNLSFLRSLAGK